MSRAVWIAVAVVVAGALLGALWPHEPGGESAWDAPDTSYSAGPNGNKALFDLLSAEGLEVTRLRRPSYDQLPPGTTLWNLSTNPLGALERRWLLAAVRSGATFIGGIGPARGLLEEAGLGAPIFSELEGEVVEGRGLKLEVERPWSVKGLEEPDRTNLARAGGEPVVASWRLGRGRLVFVGISDAARNDQIGKGDNGPFFARLAFDAGGPQVFDEFQTGFGEANLAGLLLHAPYRWGLLQAAVALAVLLLGTALRRLPPEASPRARRRQTSDQVEAVAQLWSRAGNAGLPLEALLRAAADRSRGRLGGSGGERPFVDWIGSVRPELAERASRVWDRCVAVAELAPSADRARAAAAELALLEREALAW